MRTFGKTNFKIVKISLKYLLLVFSEFADFIQLQVFFFNTFFQVLSSCYMVLPFLYSMTDFTSTTLDKR